MIDIAIANRIDNYMLSPKVYLSRNPTIRKASTELNIPIEIIKVFLKDSYESSFYNIIHCYRIEEAKDIWSEYPNTSIYRIAKLVSYRNTLIFLFHLIRREHCLPRTWKFRMGLLVN